MTELSNAVREEFLIETEEGLRQHYKQPSEMAVLKQIDRLDGYCRQMIAASPLVVLATCGSKGMDCSPKGDTPGFVQVLDDKTALIPDRPGNNRTDSLRNIVENPVVGIIFFIPGWSDTFRVNGRARISVDPDLLARFPDEKRPPKAVIVVEVEEAFLHCGRALHFADLWNPDKFVEEGRLPNLADAVKSHVGYSTNAMAGADSPTHA